VSIRRFPHPLVLLAGCVLVSSALTWVLPAGRYERRDDPETGRSVVVAGTYHGVERARVGPFAAMVAIPKGMADAGSVIFLVFLVGGAFTVVDKTGALRVAVGWLVRHLGRRELLVIPIVSVAFATGGALENMSEEIIPLVPVLLVLVRGLGFDAITAVAMSAGAAAVGAAFSPINPFQVTIGQKLAQLPVLSASGFRLVFLALALALWIGLTLRHALRTRTAPDPSAVAVREAAGARHGVVLLLVFATFAAFVVGVVRLGWGFDELSAVFFVMGVLAGLAGGLRLTGTAVAFTEGFAAMAYAAMLIGFARAIFVVLDQGRIVDTIVHGLAEPIAGLPPALSAVGMMGVHTAIHVPVPSVSGQAVLTLPVLVPVSDLIGLSRQVTVLAYQYGAGLCELLTPTNGALMAVLAAAGVPYDVWLKFTVPRWLVLLLLAVAALGLAVAINLG
jgi:uncharacterized ion transporter superfamily protein YfcC